MMWSFIELLTLVVISLAAMSFTISRSWISPTIPILLSPDSPIEIKESDIPYIVNTMMVSAILSTLVACSTIDKVGRKMIVFLSIVCYILGWIIIALATSFSHLILARFVIGLGAGFTFTCGVIYVGEISSKTNRAASCAFYLTLFNSGCPFIYLTGSHFSVSNNALVCLSVPIVAIVLLIFVPDTPHFYLIHDDITQARQVLVKLRKSEDVDEEFDEIIQYVHLSSKTQWKDLFFPPNRKPLIINLVLLAAQFWTGNLTILTFCEETLTETGASTPHTSTIFVGIAYIFGILASVVAIEHLKKKYVLIFSSLSLLITLTCLGIYAIIKNKLNVSSKLSWIPLFLMICSTIFHAFGLTVVPNVYASEMFAANVKAKAIMLFVMSVHIHGFFVAQVYIKLLKSIYWSFFLFASCCLATIIFTLFMVPHTDKLSLLEIQEKMRGEL